MAPAKVSGRRPAVAPVVCLLFLLSSLCFHAPALAQQATVPNPQFEPVRATIVEAVKSGTIPSMSVAVAKGGRIIWEESFGWANREKMVLATPHTMYSMASISKPISTTGLMILVEQGKVDLEAPVNKYIAPARLTAFEGNSDAATVRHILNHTSGLPLHYTAFYLDEPQRQPPASPESIRRYGILVHPPGKVYQYANFGFGLVDHIITKVSGRPYADFMKREVFLPLGMTHTSIDVEPALEEFAAVRYDSRGNPVPFYISDHPGASQVYSSAHDLIRFALFHLKHTQPDQKQIISTASIDRMKEDSDPDPENDRYGLGWFLQKNQYGYDVVWHTGSMNGTNTMLKFVPSEDIAVVVLINTASDLRQTIPNDIIGTLLPDFGAKWKAERDKEAEPRTAVFKPGPELIGEWKGEIRTYEETVPLAMTIQADGDVHVRIGNQMETLLNRPAFEGGFISGQSYGTIPSGDARAHPHNVSWRLLLDGKSMRGYVSTSFTAARSYGNFSSYVRLEKK